MPAWWFVVLLLAALAGLGYGTTPGERRGPVLTAASALLLVLGVLGLLTVGLPLLLAGGLGLVASRTPVVTAPGAAGP